MAPTASPRLIPLLAAAALPGCFLFPVETDAPLDATHVGRGEVEAPLAPPPGSFPIAPKTGACPDPAPPAARSTWSYAMRETPARIAPGQESIGCDRMVIRKPQSPRNAFLTAFYSEVEAGTHHQVLFFDPDPLAANRTCSNDPGSPLLDSFGNALAGGADFLRTVLKNPPSLGTGVGPYHWALPAGYGIFLSDNGDGQWVTNHHYLNATPRDIVVGGTFEVQASDWIASPLSLLAAGAGEGAIDVAPHDKGYSEGTVIAPFDLDIVVVGSHMHNYGVRFTQRFFDGERTWDKPFYASETWDSPKAQVLAEPIHLKKGQGITYRCDYVNNSDTPVRYIAGGFDGTKGAEMCSVWNYVAYPRGRGYAGLVPPRLLAGLKQNGGRATLEFDGWAQARNEAAAKKACTPGQ